MFEKALIFGLYSITPVHAGSGAELSVIDLPIQRERHTGYPVIWGQSLKGVLRRAYEKLNGSEKTEVIFGPSPETGGASERAGSISVGDAKILLFPVRSLKGVFAYVTCPMVLERFNRDRELVGLSKISFDFLLEESKAVVSKNSDIVVNERAIIEDLSLRAEGKDLSDLLKAINEVSPVEIKEGKVAVVHDNVFRNLVQIATEIVARIKINAETGTVERGALWYEEYLPSDTLLYSVIAIGKPRKSLNDLKNSDDIFDKLKKFDNTFLQIGGNETVGKGFVKVKVM